MKEFFTVNRIFFLYTYIYKIYGRRKFLLVSLWGITATRTLLRHPIQAVVPNSPIFPIFFYCNCKYLVGVTNWCDMWNFPEPDCTETTLNISHHRHLTITQDDTMKPTNQPRINNRRWL